MPKIKHSTALIFALMLTFFLDFVGLFMVYPIFAPLFLQTNTLLAPSSSYFTRTFVIGALSASYGLGQFFGGPLLGELSDQFGRKRILILGLAVLIIGNLLGVWALLANLLFMLFVCRFLTGIASGNASVIFAAISGLSTESHLRGIYMGYLTGAAAIGCVIAPLVGSYLSNPNLVIWFSWYTPFLFMAIIFLLNLLMIIYFYHDTGTYQRRPLKITTSFQNIIECFTFPNVRIMLIAYFLIVLSTESTFAGLPIFAVEKFKVTPNWLGHLFAYGSILAAFGSFYLNKKLSQKMTSGAIIAILGAILVLGYVFYFVTPTKNWLYLGYGFVGLTCAAIWAQLNAIIAGMVAENIQGKVLGVTQSLLSLSIIIGPTLIGIVAAAHYNFIVFLSLISGLAGWLVFLWLYFQNRTSPI